ncbi:hypothetical protein DFJ74DRAFT_674944 [Hyaloraphidium curvatum]|nr:hypothetical protein DFJ74DRAFT_674944 [Hyaloraphidium curvatum]
MAAHRTLTTLPNTATVAEAVAVVEREGGVIIRDMFDAETIDGLARDIGPILDTVRAGYKEDSGFTGTHTKRTGALFAKSSHMPKVALHPLYHGVAKHFLRRPVEAWLGEDRIQIVPDMQVGFTQAIRIEPGQGAQPLHRDDMSFLWRHPQYGREGRVQIMVAVSEFTAENGGTLVIPGSNHWDDQRKPERSEAVSTIMPKGSGMIFIGSTYHAGGQNNTEKARFGLSMSWDLSNLRSEENHFVSTPLSVVKQLPPEIQRGLGWSFGENYMGWVIIDGQMSDPNELLHREDYKTVDQGVPGDTLPLLAKSKL